MPFDPHKNFAYSTVATPPAPALTGTALIVAAGEGSRFPAPSFNAIVWPAGANPLPTNAEVVRVSAGPPGSDTFTVARAQESSSARAIGAGDQIADAITALALTSIEDAITALGGVVFDSTLGADTASIDTGAGAIPAGFGLLEVRFIVRTDDAAAAAQVDVTVNNDSGLKYDVMQVAGVNAAASAGNSLATAFWQLNVHGSGGSASYPGIGVIEIPAYADTTLFKIGRSTSGRTDATAANNLIAHRTLGYRDTAAITRLKIAAEGAAKLKAGSRLIVSVR